MKSFTTYLTFDGNAREAMTFYHHALGGELQLQTFAQSGMDTPQGGADRIVHARLAVGPAVVMASDSMVGMALARGNNFSIAVECDSIVEIEKLFAAFSEGGKSTMPLQDTFWGARFGMVTDRYGIGWMFNYELPKAAQATSP